MIKFVLCKVLAEIDDQGEGYEYELRESENNPERMQVWWKDKDIGWRYSLYEKSVVEEKFKEGVWIKV